MFKNRFHDKVNTWPGFVDLFSNLVIILIFLLIVFVFLWTTTSVFNKRTGAKTISELKAETVEQAARIAQMELDENEAKRLLILARNALDDSTVNQEMSLNDLAIGFNNLIEQTKVEMSEQMVQKQQQIDELTAQLAMAELDKQNISKLEQERKQLQDEMSAQRAQLSEQLNKLQGALDAAEEKSRAQETEYVEMSTRLNKALADKVAELQDATKYQSAFYRAIKIALGDDTSVQADGDRFIVPSDILFASGSYALTPAGKKQLAVIANVIKNLEKQIPSDVNWIIRVDGHTDNRPVVPGTRGYRNNLQLSLLRATAVVDALVKDGVTRARLLPAGFGSLDPIDTGDTPAALQKNRRIELQLTNR